MNFLDEIKKIGTDVESFLKAVVSGASTLQKVWSTLSGPTIAAAGAVFYDVVQAVSSGESAAASAASGNALGAFALSETTLGLVQKVVADFKAGSATVKADFEALGIKL